MWKLVPIIVIALVLAAVAEYNSTYELDSYGGKKYIRKDVFFYVLMVIAMAFFVGLRISGNDTGTYIRMYEDTTPGFAGIFGIDWLSVSSAPGLQAVSIILRTIGATTQDYLMLFALATISIYLWFLRKRTDSIWLSVFFFIFMGVYTFAMAAIKQTFAVALLLIATDRAIDKKHIRFIIWVAVAELFHPYAFIYLIVPFLFFNPWTKRTWVLLGGTVAVGLGLNKLMGGILAMTEAMGADYDVNEFTGEGVNIFRVLVVWVPVVISFFARKALQVNEDRSTNLCMNLAMINAMIMFIGLFGTANYFARLANYFLIFQAIALPWLFRFFERRSKILVVGVSLLCYGGFFYYQSVLAQGAFDNVYNFISVGDFFRQLL